MLTHSGAQAENSREFLSPRKAWAQKAGGEGELNKGRVRNMLSGDVANRGKTAQAQRSSPPVLEAAFWRAETWPSWSLVFLGPEQQG